MYFYAAAASVTSFVIGNITGAVVCKCILLLFKYLIKKKGVRYHKVKCDNPTNPVVYDEIGQEKYVFKLSYKETLHTVD